MSILLDNKPIQSINEFINKIEIITAYWNKIDPFINKPWFRGEDKDDTLLKPKLFKFFDQIESPAKQIDFENEIVQNFRMKARSFCDIVPDYNRIDEWLFLMRHFGAPTRLLDWTTGALIALFFAINDLVKVPDRYDSKKAKPVVWMLNPLLFNLIASGRFFLPLSWNDGSNLYHKESYKYYIDEDCNISNLKLTTCPANFHAAFEAGKCEYEEYYPTALHPQNINKRLTAQRSCFTVHGKNRSGIQEIFADRKLLDLIIAKNKTFRDNVNLIYNQIEQKDNNLMFGDIVLIKLEIDSDYKILRKMMIDLEVLGISYSNLFPDLEGLCNELSNEFYLRLKI
jgi:hypothetical protein